MNTKAKVEISVQVDEKQLIQILENLKPTLKDLRDLEIEVEYTDGTTEKIV